MSNIYKVLIFLLFVIILWTFVEAVCPDNCMCYLDHEPRKIFCSHRGLDEFPSNISDLVEHLDVSKNNLKIVGSDIGRLIELRYLNLAKNQLIGLPGEIGELWKLERLDLSENNIHGVGESIAAITRLPNLRILYLAQNPLTGIQELSNAALRSLDVSGCTISGMTNESLEGMPELISLNIENNPITTVQRIKSNKLKWLDMSNCRLNILSSNTFEDLPELEQLRLANNPNLVYSTRKETLRHEKLKRFDASGCNLDRPGLQFFPSLTQAILSRNVIRFLPDKIFSRNKMLMYLALDGNGLNQVNGSSFTGMPALETLDLSSNSLSILPPGLFKDSINMRLLNLSNNEIRLFPDNFTLSAMTLDLSINLIESIDEKNIKNMPRIRSLNLAKNRLISFAADLESKTLKSLSLEGNRISKLTNKSFSNLPALVEVDLSGNRLTEAFSCNIFSLNNHLQKILLDDNPWRCDCEQMHLIYLYLTRSGMTSSSSLICQSPSNVSGDTWSTACQAEWSTDTSKVSVKDKLYQLGLMGLFICVLVFGTVVSIGHTVRTKRRQALLRIREAERAEARERLILHRRTLEIEARYQQHQPRIHPEEIIGPPTYEEAVQLPRLARSLDRLDSLSTEGIGNSGQSIADQDAWARKRRMQSRKRINKRARSEDHLNARSEDRTRHSSRFFKDRSMSVPRRNSTTSVNRSKINSTEMIISRQKASMTSDSDEQPGSGSSSLDDMQSRITRSRTSIASKKKRRRLLMRKNEHSSDDEDSENRRRSMQNLKDERIKVISLPREPRSGTYRPLNTTLSQQSYHRDSDAAELQITRSHIV